MAVYTTLSESQVNQLLDNYDLPHVAQLEGAQEGIENTTYFLTLQDKQVFVLTVFEQVPSSLLASYAAFTSYLHQQQLPVPAPLADSAGVLIHKLHNKPAWLVPKINGRHPLQAEAEHCRQLGEILARCHLASASYPDSIDHPAAADWLLQQAKTIYTDLCLADREILQQQIQQAEAFRLLDLPRAIIHGDLFRDNVLFDNRQLTAVIDFNNAGKDFLLLDLAIVANDWCLSDAGALLKENLDALLEAYQAVRPISAEEWRYWPGILDLAATRFWVSRLLAAKKAAEQNLPSPKNPDFFRKLLQKNPLSGPK